MQVTLLENLVKLIGDKLDETIKRKISVQWFSLFKSGNIFCACNVKKIPVHLEYHDEPHAFPS